MCLHIDQPPRARNRRVVRRHLVQPDAHKAPQRQRVRQPPGNPTLAVDALEIADQQRAKVNPRRQRRPPALGRIELRAPPFDKFVEALGLQQLVQPLIERMSRRRRQLGVRNPDVLLLLPLLAGAHCHARIVETKAVDRSIYFVQVSRLSPQAAKRDLQEKEQLIAAMSLRVDAIGKKTDPNHIAASSVDMSAADPKLVQLINNLQEQVYAERRENRRLKGA